MPLSRLETAIQSFWAWIIPAAIAGLWYVIRRIFTNEQKIAVLQKSIEKDAESRLVRYVEQSKHIEGLQADVKEMRGDIKTLLTQPK